MSQPRGYVLEIFRSGVHTSVSGRQVKITDYDVTLTAAAYQRHSATHEAKLCIGHPEGNEPSHGVVRELRAACPHLLAYVEPDDDLRDMVNAGRFKKVSACFWTPEAKQNPEPGTFYLRHVGFLGAHPPAVKGLRDARFAEGYDLVQFDGNDGHFFSAQPLPQAFWNPDRSTPKG